MIPNYPSSIEEFEEQYRMKDTQPPGRRPSALLSVKRYTNGSAPTSRKIAIQQREGRVHWVGPQDSLEETAAILSRSMRQEFTASAPTQLRMGRYHGSKVIVQNSRRTALGFGLAIDPAESLYLAFVDGVHRLYRE